MRSFAGIPICVLLTIDTFSQITQWPESDRSGNFHETGLLTGWSDQDPEMVFNAEDTGLTALVIVAGKLLSRYNEVLLLFKINS